MMGMMKRQTSARWWWSESHQTPGRSPWLQSTLAEKQGVVEGSAKRMDYLPRIREDELEHRRIQRSLADNWTKKTKAMVQLIKKDADSFAFHAEMYYNKRPQLISMAEDFYHAHRSLAEKYDQVKSDSGTRLVIALGTSFSSTKSRLEKSMSGLDRTYNSFLEIHDHEESAESEVDDLE